MFCNQCGAKIVEGTKFCMSCGARVIEPEQPQNATVVQEQQPVQEQQAWQQPVQEQQAWQQPVQEQQAWQQPVQEQQPQAWQQPVQEQQQQYQQPQYQQQQYQPQYQQPMYQQQQYQPQYQQPLTPLQAEEKTILIFGIIAIVCGCSVFASIGGIIFGIINLIKIKKYIANGGTVAGKSKTGQVLSIIGLISGACFTTGSFIYSFVWTLAEIL